MRTHVSSACFATFLAFGFFLQSSPGQVSSSGPAPATVSLTTPPAPWPAPGPGIKSLYDSIAPVSTTILVEGVIRPIDTTTSLPFEAGGVEIMTTAGSYGDISRYLQLFPGVVATSDISSQILVRGGHPMENLFVVDGMEVPNINHLADSNTTGGFGPMIDAGVVQGEKIYTAGFSARYPERLSSVTEIQTLDESKSPSHMEGDFGIEGIGGMFVKNMLGGNLLTSAHHGLLNLISNNIGMNGVPTYTKELTRSVALARAAIISPC